MRNLISEATCINGCSTAPKRIISARTSIYPIFCVTFLLALPAVSNGQTVFATGLNSPAKVIGIGEGNLLVAEAGELVNSGRISLINSAGLRRTIIDGLPSGLAGPELAPDGPTGIELRDEALYITMGEGDTHVNGPTPGTIIPNPKSPSSPIFSTVLRVRFSEQVLRLLTGFTLSLPNQFTLADGKSISIDNSFDQYATIQLLGALRVDRPDPASIYRNTHLYKLALSRRFPDQIFVTDAGNNSIWQLDLRASVPSVLTHFPNIPNPPGTVPAAGEASPTSIRAYGDHLLVSEFSGAPFLPGNSIVASVDSNTGAVTPVVKNLSFAIDALEVRQGFRSGILIVEYSTDLLTGAPVQLLFYDGKTTKVLANRSGDPKQYGFRSEERFRPDNQSKRRPDSSSSYIVLTPIIPGTV